MTSMFLVAPHLNDNILIKVNNPFFKMYIINNSKLEMFIRKQIHLIISNLG